ncbi:MAG: hypothetical protein ACJ78U_00375, partial [Myxococcales bacterium]
PAEAPVRQELKDFEKFQESAPGTGKKTALVVVVSALVLALAYVFLFSVPRVREIDGRTTNSPGIVRIELGETAARVVVADSFVEKPEPALSQLMSLLREQKMSNAVLVTATGAPAGQIDLKSGATAGIRGLKQKQAAPAANER